MNHPGGESAWGLTATGVVSNRATSWTGRGVRIAVLDSGIDLAHVAFAGRIVATESFVPGKTVQDTLGHGTHCAGVAAGCRDERNHRYGVACEADLCIGRVLDDVGDADVDRVVAAIDWAVAIGCEIIALPLGTTESLRPDPFEEAGARALAAGCLPIAAAGNGRLRPLAQPASAASVLSVGAIDWWLRLAEFNPRAADGAHAAVDLVAPGVDVYGPGLAGRYRTRTGTSMAAAHVAGLAALWVEATGLRGGELRNRLLESAQPLRGEEGSEVAALLATAPAR